MSDFPTFDELFRVGRDEALSRNPAITRDAIERQGTDANALVAAGAASADEVIGQLATVEKAVYLDSAQARQLDRLVFDRYGLLRKPAAPSRGTVEFTLPAPSPGSFAIPINTRLSTSDGRLFLTSASATFPMASSGPISVSVRSALAGISQQAKVGSITSILDTVSGAPSGLTVTNSLATAGADDEEKDDSLRDRARRFFTNARRGTVSAIELAAVGIPGVRKAAAFEVVDSLGRPAKVVQLVISDAFTEQLVDVTPVPPAYEAQSQVLADTVFQGLSDTRPAGIYVQVTVAEVILQAVMLGLTFVAGVNVDQVALQARAAMVAYMNSLNPGAPFERDTAIERLRTVAGLFISGNEVLSPAGDVQPALLQVLRTTLGLTIVTTLQPDRALQGSTNPDA